MGIRTITPEREVSRGEIAAPGSSNVGGGGAGGGGHVPMNPYLSVPDARQIRLESLRPIGIALRDASLANEGNEIVALTRRDLSEMADGVSDGEGVQPWTDARGVKRPGLNAAFDNEDVSSDDLDKALAQAHESARQKLEKRLQGKSQAVRNFVHAQVDGDIENWRARFEERAITRRMKENVKKAGEVIDADAGAIGSTAIADLANDKAQAVDIIASGGDPEQIEAARREKTKAIALDFANRTVLERQRAVGNLIVQSGGLMSQQEAERRVGAIYDRRAQEMIFNLARSGNYNEAKAFIEVGHLMGYSEEAKAKATDAVNSIIVNDAKSRIATATTDEEIGEVLGNVEEAGVDERLYDEVRELGDRKRESLAEFRRREEFKATNDFFDQRELDVFAPREDGSTTDPAMWADQLEAWSKNEDLRRVNPKRALSYANQARELKEAAAARKERQTEKALAKAQRDAEATRKTSLDLIHKSIIELDILRNPSPYDPPMSDEDRANRIREVQDAVARRMRTALWSNSISAAEYDSLYGRFRRELNAQQKLAMQMFYREMGVSADSLAMTDSGALTSAGVNDLQSVRFYKTNGYGEDGTHTTEIKSTLLLQLGDSLLKTLAAMGDDMYKPEVVKKAVADAKTAFVKGNTFDMFRESLMKNVEAIRLNDLAEKAKRPATKETKTDEK